MSAHGISFFHSFWEFNLKAKPRKWRLISLSNHCQWNLFLDLYQLSVFLRNRMSWESKKSTDPGRKWGALLQGFQTTMEMLVIFPFHFPKRFFKLLCILGKSSGFDICADSRRLSHHIPGAISLASSWSEWIQSASAPSVGERLSYSYQTEPETLPSWQTQGVTALPNSGLQQGWNLFSRETNDKNDYDCRWFSFKT